MEPSQTNSSIHENDEAHRKHNGGGWITFPFIIGAVLGLSTTGGGLISNLIVFLISEYNIKSISATQINNVILGFNYLFPIAASFLADSFFSSFSVVTAFASLSLLGMMMLTIVSTIHSLRPPPCGIGSSKCESPSHLQYALLYFALALPTLGIGGTRFTVASMGADQFHNPNHQSSFFNWYFLALYIAAITSFTALVYLQDNVSWGLAFGVCMVANAIALALFLLGKRFYRQIKPKGSPFVGIARIVVAAVRKRKLLSGRFQSQDYYHGETKIRGPGESFRFLNSAALKTESDNQSDGLYGKSWSLCTVDEVEDLKTLIKIMPLWSTSILLSTTIAIISNFTILQALTMDRHLGPHFKIPPASFLVFNLLSTAVSIFVIDRLLLPMWQNLSTHRSILQRIGIGHVINIFAMVGSAIIESRRLSLVRANGHLAGQLGSTVPMSGLWLIMPLAILGVGEGFHFPTQVAFYYQEFPKSLRSTATAMISLAIGISYYMSTAITDVVRRSTGWLPNDINQGRLDKVYWMLAVIGVMNFGYYVICANLFNKYRNVDESGDSEEVAAGFVH